MDKTDQNTTYGTFDGSSQNGEGMMGRNALTG